MNTHQEWQQLKLQLRNNKYDISDFRNQFFRQLIRVLLDPSAMQTNRLLAYRDGLLASPHPESEKLPIHNEQIGTSILTRFGLGIDRQNNVHLTKKELIENLDLSPIYRLEKRRFLHQVTMDPALRGRLSDSHFESYNGLAQQLAVRLAITKSRRSTLIINLPTGCGKTLVAHAVSLFSNNSQLTLVIVPTIALAIEQGARAEELFRRSGHSHSGQYFWHSGQSKEQHNAIKERIRTKSQKMLFCSPESACRSLLPILFQTSTEGSLGCIAVDEAHIVDQWGTQFRPYFQIVASLIRSLRSVSREGIKCILMSATFTEKSMGLVRELFGLGRNDCVHVNGSFLRPEVQFEVSKVSQFEHLERILNAAVALPKPAIIYTLFPDHAKSIHLALQRTGMNRLGLFTGKTSTDARESLLQKWQNRDIDVMVATSAFGLGVDKADIRSVIHAAVPENIDRFYQEVGRGGRDGLASQSLLVYSDAQIREAERLNNDRLITVELGLRKWRAMWDHGTILPDGRRKVPINALRSDQQHQTEGNQEWNWRTLLLMQRTGLIRIELERPCPPSASESVDSVIYQHQLSSYYDKYYNSVTIAPLRDDHLNPEVWEQLTSKRRLYEKKAQHHGLNVLLRWMQNHRTNRLCDLLTEHYTIDGMPPEYACGGCPRCQRDHSSVKSPTVGMSVQCTGAQLAKEWTPPLLATATLRQYVYYPVTIVAPKRLIRTWSGWIVRLIESGAIRALCAEPDVLEFLQAELKNRTNTFWVGNVLGEVNEDSKYWPELVFQMNVGHPLPSLGWPDSVKVLVAPEALPDAENLHRKWWQSQSGSVSLNNFLSSLD